MWRLKTMASSALLALAAFAMIGIACRVAEAGSPEPSSRHFAHGCACSLR